MPDTPALSTDLSPLFEHAPAEEREQLETQYRQDLERVLANCNLNAEDQSYARTVFLQRIVRFDKAHRPYVNAHMPMNEQLLRRVLLGI